MASQQLTIRRMGPDDLAFAFHLIQGEGWDVGNVELEHHLACEPEGCLIAEKSQRSIGMIMPISYGELGWIGNLIVAPDQRGRGIGTELMRQTIQYLAYKGAQTIRLDAEPAAVSLYGRLGFVQECRSLRFRGRGVRFATLHVEPMRSTHLDDVMRLDVRCFGANCLLSQHRAL